MSKNFLRLKEALSERKISGKDFAEKVGVTPMTVSRWVTGKIQPTYETLFQIADALGVDVCDLLATGDKTERAASISPEKLSGSVLVLLEVDKAKPENIWLVDLFEDAAEMVATMNGKGYAFPDADTVTVAVSKVVPIWTA